MTTGFPSRGRKTLKRKGKPAHIWVMIPVNDPSLVLILFQIVLFFLGKCTVTMATIMDYVS